MAMIRRWVFFSLLLAMPHRAIADDIPSRDISQISDSSIGIDFQTFESDPLNSPLTSRTARTIAANGVKWARVFASWDKIERATGTYTFQGLDNVINRLKSEGYKIFITINGGFTNATNLLYGNALET